MMKDKDIKAVLEIMQPLVYDWFLAPLDNPRAATCAMMQEVFTDCGINKVFGNFRDFKSAVHEVERNAQTGDLVLVFGSFFLVSAYLTEFGSNRFPVSHQLDGN